MALHQSDAFVLHTYKLGEADQIVVLFTRAFGKLRVVARRHHQPRRHSASYCQPLMLLRAIVFGRPNQALYRMQSVDIVAPFRPLHEDFTLLRCGLYATELVDAATHEREPAPELFALLHAALEQLTHTAAPDVLLRLFEVRALMIMGYTPQLACCAHCGHVLQPHECTFSPRLGGLLCATCAPTTRQTVVVSPEALTYLRLAVANAAQPLCATSLEHAIQQDLERLLHAHLTACLGRELKSYAFLHL